MARCPVCGKEFKPQESTAMPMCSERCKMIDLGRWLDEKYSIPSVPDQLDDLEDEPTNGPTANPNGQ